MKFGPRPPMAGTLARFLPLFLYRQRTSTGVENSSYIIFNRMSRSETRRRSSGKYEDVLEYQLPWLDHNLLVWNIGVCVVLDCRSV